MEFGEKEFSYYWKIIKVPVLLLIGWSIAAIITAKISIDMYLTIFSGIASLILQVAVFGFIGYATIAENKGAVKNSFWAGALAGAIVGFAGAVLNIIAMYLVPEIIEFSINQAASQGVDSGMIRQITSVMTYIGLLIAPIFGGLIGGLISWISGLISKKVAK